MLAGFIIPPTDIVEALGKTKEAERDFQKAKELGYNP